MHVEDMARGHPPIILLSSQYLGPYDMNNSSPASISRCAITGQCQIPGSLMCSNLTLHLSSIRGSLMNLANTDLHGKASTKPSFIRAC